MSSVAYHFYYEKDEGSISTLAVERLHKSFGDKKILSDLSLHVNEGDIYGFVGSNGAGKSTTMRIIIGVLLPESGEVLFDGKPIDADLRKRIGYMPEERGLYGKESIIDQLVFLSQLHGISASTSRANAFELLERLGLVERAHDKLDSLSLGNQQKVQLAAALVHSPDLLILDEPFSGLDPLAVNAMGDILAEYAQRGVPVLFSSHQLDLVQRICNSIGILAGGKLVAEDTVSSLRSQGPLRYRVDILARGWYPGGVSVVSEDSTGVVLELPGEDHVQPLLCAAQAAGVVTGFYRVVPDLADLFRKYVS